MASGEANWGTKVVPGPAAVEVLEAAAERDLDDGPLEPLALAPRAARAAAEEVAHAAEGFGLDCEFHGGGLAHRHCIAAIRNTNYYELGLLHPLVDNTKPPVYPPEFTDELKNVDANGHVLVPQGPGLGVEMDWDYIERHKSGATIFE